MLELRQYLLREYPQENARLLKANPDLSLYDYIDLDELDSDDEDEYEY